MEIANYKQVRVWMRISQKRSTLLFLEPKMEIVNHKRVAIRNQKAKMNRTPLILKP